MTQENKKIFKEDINFLEYPTWVLSTKNKAVSWVIEKGKGKYEISSLKGLPAHFDKLVLYFLLYKLSENDFNSTEINTTRYEIAKNIFNQKKVTGRDKFERIMISLRKWKTVSIHFEGIFYEGDAYRIKGFSIIDEYEFNKETKELYIRFNNAYIKQLKESKFYKLIDFEQYKKFSKASSARLFEILIKTFKDRNEWVTNIQSLAEKLTFEKRPNAKMYYPSDILRSLKPSINEINKKSDIEIDFKYNSKTGICLFKKVKKAKGLFVPAEKEDIKKSNKKKQLEDCINQFNLLPQEKQQEIINAIKRDDFLKYQPNDKERIFSYMTRNKLLESFE
jgi:hypothetical protein